MELTSDTRTDLVYLILSIGSFVLKPQFKAQVEPTDLKIQRVGGGKENMEGFKLGSGQGSTLRIHRSVMNKGGFEKGYGSVMTKNRSRHQETLDKYLDS